MEFLVCCVFAYYLVRHAPEIVGEAAEQWQAARRGEESPAATARRARLSAAGIDPATGGAFGQYAGNLWRDFWVDQDQARQARRNGRDPASTASRDGSSVGGSWWGRARDRFDRAVDGKVDGWRTRRDTEPVFPIGTDNPPSTTSGREPTDGESKPIDDESPEEEWLTPDPDEPFDGPGVIHDSDEYTNPEAGEPPAADTTVPPPEPDRPPIRVDATVGEPLNTPDRAPVAVLELERNPMSDVATRGGAVTGMATGAAEARSIVRALDAASAAYNAAIVSAQQRIHSLGEQTVGTVQMATRSAVVARTAQAAEAIAAARAGVNLAQAEVVPLMGQVAREFEKRAN